MDDDYIFITTSFKSQKTKKMIVLVRTDEFSKIKGNTVSSDNYSAQRDLGCDRQDFLVILVISYAKISGYVATVLLQFRNEC